MVAIEEIVDSETFKAWLEEQPEEDRSEIAVTLAMRSAARVFPIWASVLSEDWTHQRDLTAIATCRAILLSAVVDKLPHSDIWRFAGEAADAGYEHGAFVNAVESEGGTVSDVIYAAASAADAKASYDSAFEATFYAENVYPDVWSVLQHDIRASNLQHNLSERRLWPERMPVALAEAWKAAQSWLKEAPGHDFFLRWYSALLEGLPMTGDWDSHWKMLEEIALIDPKDWDKGNTSAGAVELAAIIAEIEEKYKTPPKPKGNLGEDALALTQRNEQVSVNPKTGKLYIEARDPLPQVLYDRMQRKLNRALRKFDRVEGNGAYFLLYQDTQDWHLDINQIGNLPTDLYEICGEIVAHVKRRDRNGEIPDAKTDTLIAGFLEIVQSVGVEIYSADPETREFVERVQSLMPNTALEEETAALLKTAQFVGEHSDPGALSDLPETGKKILAPVEDEQDLVQHSQRVTFVGRLLRAMGALGWSFSENVFKAAGKTIGTTAGFAAVAALDAASLQVLTPYWQSALSAIFRFLGLG
ncbi:hypothetical protein [Epibacterium ulvae]|uniref:hypothetical protein n=1 Tax=Epibacterium ulvae TaxID=1156985 RepID=UPI00248FB5F4|nr:hypothetical protein [Epibacterium ulvae]